MKTSIRFVITSLLFVMTFSLLNKPLFAREVATPTVTDSDAIENKSNSHKDPSSAIVIHKPATDPAWGKVIQYQSEISALNHEVLHKFVFQDSKGVVRNATYHENTSESGYWEVWVWDQP